MMSSPSDRMPTEHRPSPPALWYTLLRPEAGRTRDIQRRLAAGGSVRLEVRMEILEMDPATGRALLWIPDAQGARQPRLASAHLPPARRAEVLLAQQDGARVSVLICFQVLGRHGNGFSAVTCNPDGELLVEPMSAERDLSELLG